jgi:hypothetical protein
MVLCRAILYYFEQVSREASRKSDAQLPSLVLTFEKLFYGKRSQFVSGVEQDQEAVSVGRSVSSFNPLAKYNNLIFAGNPRTNP